MYEDRQQSVLKRGVFRPSLHIEFENLVTRFLSDVLQESFRNLLQMMHCFKQALMGLDKDMSEVSKRNWGKHQETRVPPNLNPHSRHMISPEAGGNLNETNSRSPAAPNSRVHHAYLKRPKPKSALKLPATSQPKQLVGRHARKAASTEKGKRSDEISENGCGGLPQ